MKGKLQKSRSQKRLQAKRDIYGDSLKLVQGLAALPNGQVVTDIDQRFSPEVLQILKDQGITVVSMLRKNLMVDINLDGPKTITKGNDKIFLKQVITLKLPSANPTEVRIPDVRGISGQHDGWINWKLLAVLLERIDAHKDRVTANTDVTTISVVIDNETGKVIKQHRSRQK